LLRLVTVDEQGRPTRWRVLRDELPEPIVAPVAAFRHAVVDLWTVTMKFSPVNSMISPLTSSARASS
jgi:hypothetical protein